MPAPYPAAFSGRLCAIFLLSAASLLVACGRNEPSVSVNKQGDAVYHTGESGVDVQVAKDGESLEVADKLPAFAPIYPGATVKTQLSDASGKGGKDGATGGLWVMETSDPVAKVAAFYDEQAKKAGVKPGMFVNEKDSAVRIFGSEGASSGKAEGALIAISFDEEDRLTKIVITAGTAISQADSSRVDDRAADGPPPMQAAPQRLQ